MPDDPAGLPPPTGTIGPIEREGLLNKALGAAGDVASGVGKLTDKIPSLLLEHPELLPGMGLPAAAAYGLGQQAKATGGALQEWSEGFPPIDWGGEEAGPRINPSVRDPEQLMNVAALAPIAGKVARAAPGVARTMGGIAEESLARPPGAGIRDWHRLMSHPFEEDPNYVYHATTEEQANDARTAGIQLHDRYGERNYFTAKSADAALYVPPTGGKKVILRVPKSAHPFRQGTGTALFSDEVIDPKHVQYMAGDKTWQPLVYPPERIQLRSEMGSGYPPRNRHVYTTAGGRSESQLVVYETPSERKTRVGWANTQDEYRGRDYMKALLKKAVDDAYARGQRFFSDTSVSGGGTERENYLQQGGGVQRPSYYALEKQGYTIIENPADGDGAQFEVIPPNAEKKGPPVQMGLNLGEPSVLRQEPLRPAGKGNIAGPPPAGTFWTPPAGWEPKMMDAPGDVSDMDLGDEPPLPPKQE